MTYKPDNKQQLIGMIRDYFYYQSHKCGHGYARETRTGKIASFDIGGTKKPTSSVPSGVEFTHPVELERYNETALMLMALYDDNKQRYLYLYTRYGVIAPDKVSQTRVGQLMGLTQPECSNLEKKIFEFLNGLHDKKEEPRQIAGVRLVV